MESEAVSSRQLLRQVQQSVAETRELRKELHEIKVLIHSQSQQSRPPLFTAPLTAVHHVVHAPPSNQPHPTRLERPPPSCRTALAPSLPPAPALVVPLNIPLHRPPPAPVPAPSPSPAAPLRITSRSIVIHDKIILYDRDRLTAPPHRDYSANPELLADDWEHLLVSLSPGQVEDIGVKFWKQLYKGTKHWERLRKKYSNWAVRAAAFMASVTAAPALMPHFSVCRNRVPQICHPRSFLGGVLNRRPASHMDPTFKTTHAQTDRA